MNSSTFSLWCRTGFRQSLPVLAFVVFGICVGVEFVAPEEASAQIESPDRRYLFREDRNKDVLEKRQRQERAARKQGATTPPPGAPQLPFDISASTLTYDSTGNKVNAEGDVLITYSTLIAEAQSGQVDITNNNAFLKGEVRLTDVTSEITADEAQVDLTNGTGVMRNADIYFAEGDYHLFAKEAKREEDEVYSLRDALLSTCNCPEGDSCPPWSISTTSGSIQQNGYGSTWNNVFRVQDIPVFYVPYLLFPVKNERQSGLLPPTFGGGRRRNSVDLQVPLFLVFDESTDSTVTTVYESRVRIGTDIEFRKIFSESHKLQSGLVYFDESARNGDLLGVDVSDLDDQEPDENRLAGYWNQNLNAKVLGNPVQFIVDGHYASDDLFIREYEKVEIAKYNSRFITSQAVLRAPLGGSYSADLSAEYNQSIETDDDFVFQRIPELTLTGLESFRPFGENPLGMKLVLNSTATSVNFMRRRDYTGQRHELYERLSLPFHLRNYFEGSVEGDARASLYDATLDRDDGEEPSESRLLFEGNSSRFVPGLSGKLGTVVERVYSPAEDNLLKYVGELGRSGRQLQISRFKHTVEPGLRYRYVPDVDQFDNPQFDSSDRLAERNVMTYGITQRLLARYEPRNTYLYGIEEVTPELEDLGNLRSDTPIDPNLTFGVDAPRAPSAYSSLRRGTIQELVQFKLSQSYDLLTDDEENVSDPKSGASADAGDTQFSDVAADLIFFPNDHVHLRTRTNYDVEQQDFSDYTLEGNALTKRGDTFISRLRFIEGGGSVRATRQLESGVEVRLTDFVKAGYYSRYDDERGEFIEQKGGLRFYSKCQCWVFDVVVTDKVNPDETRYAFNITLIGLGQVGNTFFTSINEENR